MRSLVVGKSKFRVVQAAIRVLGRKLTCRDDVRRELRMMVVLDEAKRSQCDTMAACHPSPSSSPSIRLSRASVISELLTVSSILAISYGQSNAWSTVCTL